MTIRCGRTATDVVAHPQDRRAAPTSRHVTYFYKLFSCNDLRKSPRKFSGGLENALEAVGQLRPPIAARALRKGLMGLPKLALPIADRSPVDHAGPLPSAGIPEAAWRVLTEIGFALAIVGGADLILAWYPLAFQNPEWEFGTVTATLDGMPVLALGLGLMLAGSLTSGSRWLTRTVVFVFGFLGFAIIAAALLYATNIPLALQAISDPTVRIGLFKAILKSTVQAIVYSSVFLWIAFRGWR